MPDTMRGDFPDEICSDCGEKGCVFKHWGPLVPEEDMGSFCGYCWTRRDKLGSLRIPLGFQPPGIPEEFQGKSVKVTTNSGAIYLLKPTDKKDEVKVARDKGIDFTVARVLCLKQGEQMWLKPRDSDNLSLWWTSPVCRTETIG